MDSFPSSNNGAAALSYLTYGTQDPTVTPTNGTPGLLFIRVGRVANGKIGAVGLYQKTLTAGQDTNWQMYGTGSNAYTPSVPADWDAPIPNNVPAALDQLADRVKVLEVGAAFQIERLIYVSMNGNDTDGTGSIDKPYLTIQKAVDEAAFGSIILVAPGAYAEDIVVEDPNSLLIAGISAGFDSPPVVIEGTVTVQGSMTRFRMRDIQVSALNNSDVPLTINGTEGRHYFWNVTLNKPSGADSKIVNVVGAFTRWIEFTDCALSGEVYLGGTPVGTPSVRMIRGNDYNCRFIVDNSAYDVKIEDTVRLGALTHNAGRVTLSNVAEIQPVGGIAIASVATDSPTTNRLTLRNVNFRQFNGNVFGLINKTGNCDYIVDGCERDTENDVLSGNRLGYGNQAIDLGYIPASPGSWPIVPENVKEALDIIQTQMGVIGPIQDVVYVAKNGSDTTGDGGIDKPYLTVAAAMASITANAPTRRHVIFVMPGRYTEVGLTIKPNVFIVGYEYLTTRIQNSVPFAPEAGFAAAGDHRSGFVNINIASAVAMDFNAVASNEGKFYIKNCQITAGYTFTAFSNINQSFVVNSDVFGGISQVGGAVLVEECNIFSGGVTIAPRVGGSTSFQGSACVNAGNFTVNGNGVDPIAVSLYQFNPGGTFTADGAAVTVSATVDSLPATSSFLNSAVKTLLSKSQNVDYTPAAPGSWPVVPANVKDALDELIGLIGGTSVLPLSNVVYVAKNGNDGTADGSIAKPFLTIQAAINSTGATVVASPKVILIAPGVYTENFIQIRPNMYLVALTRGTVSIVNSVTFGINQSVGAGAFNGGSVGLVGIRVTSPVYDMRTTNGTSFTVRCIDCEFNGSMLFHGGGPAHVFYSQNCVYQTPTSVYTLRIRSCYLFSTNDKITYFEQYHESLDANPRLKSEFMGSEITTFAGNGNGTPLLESTVVLNSSPVGAFTGAAFLLIVRASVDSLDDTSATELGAILTLTSLAQNVGYVPAAPGNWITPPTQVKSALDSLAARATVVEERSISVGEAAAKQLTLNSLPFNVNNVSVSFMGVEQTDTVDFSVTGGIVDWSGLGLDTIGVVAGDVMVITYEKQ